MSLPDRDAQPVPAADWVARTACPLCGYDLHGLGEDPTCPECGLPHLSPAIEFHDEVQPPRWSLVAVLLVATAEVGLRRSGHMFAAGVATAALIVGVLGALYLQKSRPSTDAPLRARIGRGGLTQIQVDGSWRYWSWDRIGHVRCSRLTGQMVLLDRDGARLAVFTFARRRARRFLAQLQDAATHGARECDGR